MKSCPSAKRILALQCCALFGSAAVVAWLFRGETATLATASLMLAPTLLVAFACVVVFARRETRAQHAFAALQIENEERVRDAAAHERSCRAAEVAAGRFRALLEQLPNAVVVVDPSDEVVILNAAAQDLLQCNRVTRVHALPQAVASIMAASARAPEGTRRSREISIRTEVGTLALRVESVVRDGVAIGVIVDLAAEKDAERRMGEFVAKASHELRTPLTSLRAYAEMLVDGDSLPEEERRRLSETMLTESDRLSRMVDQMLSISRIESGIARIESVSVDLQVLAQEAVDAMRGEAMSRNISLLVAPCAVSATAAGDRDMLKQVLLNLVSNGIKYTPEGGSVTLTVDTDNLARSVVVYVSDTGPGIPEDAKGRLFEKFYRVENYRRLAKGTGLGLNLCRSVIEQLHGGHIGVESSGGMGSRFWFSVPMERVGRIAA